MYATVARSLTHSVPLQAAGLLTLAAGSALVASMANPLLVPVAIIALIGGGVLMGWPYLGTLAMFAMVLFKPEALQGGLSVNAALAAALAPVLFLDIMVRRRFGVLESSQLRIFTLMGVVLLVNWYLLGRINAPAHLADLDLTNRSLFRFGFHFVFLTLMIAFIRTPGQVRALTGLFFLSVLFTLPSALSRSYGDGPVGGKSADEHLRAAGSGGVQAAENANRLAFLALMGISLVWFWMREVRNPLLRITGMGTILVLVLTVFLTGSRSGLLNLGLLLVLILVQSKVKIGQVVAIALLIVMCFALAALFVPQPVLDRMLTTFGMGDPDRLKGAAVSTSRRIQIFQSGLTMFSENPLMGIGLGNFRWMTAEDLRFGGVVMAAHNAYLLTLAEGGILLMGVQLLLFWVTWRNLSWVVKRATAIPQVGLGWLALATRTNLVLLLFFSFFAEAWKEFYYLLILATAAILTQIYRQRSADA